MKLVEITSILACPDDGSKIENQENLLICSNCKREFFVKNNFIDLRPKQLTKLEHSGNVESKYDSYYKNLRSDSKINTFGLVSKSVPSGFVNETINFLKKHIGHNQIVCDVGAGGGDYSINLSRDCKIMFHCDLDMNGIILSQKRAVEQKLDNIIFLQCDYFKLPFQDNVIDLVYSIDVIERGLEHDKQLLKQIKKVIKQNGFLLFDCHTSERYALTRTKNEYLTTYSKKEISKLIETLSLRIIEIGQTGFLPQIRNWSNFEYNIFNLIARKFYFPSARWIFCVKK